MKKRLICTGLVVILIVGVIICSGFASSLSITEDFENGIDAFNWRQLYNNANCDMMSEDGGNHYSHQEREKGFVLYVFVP